MPNEYHRGINMCPEMTRKRLQFLHVSWLVLMLSLGIAGLLMYVPAGPLVAGIFIAMVPGVAGSLLFVPGNDDPGLSGALLVTA